MQINTSQSRTPGRHCCESADVSFSKSWSVLSCAGSAFTSSTLWTLAWGPKVDLDSLPKYWCIISGLPICNSEWEYSWCSNYRKQCTVRRKCVDMVLASVIWKTWFDLTIWKIVAGSYSANEKDIIAKEVHYLQTWIQKRVHWDTANLERSPCYLEFLRVKGWPQRGRRVTTRDFRYTLGVHRGGKLFLRK